MRFPSGLRALNHRDFRLFWTGQLISLVGRWMQSVGQAWLVLELTNSPLKLGIVGALQFAPILVLAFVAGALADRLPKRLLIVTTQLALMIPALSLAALIWSGHIMYWHVVVGACVIGTVNALDMPARQSLIVELVGKTDLLNAIALNSAMFNAARVAGPAIAGLLIARYGVAVAFLLNGISFLAVVAALLAMRVEGFRRAQRETTIREEIADGLRYALGSPVVSLILSLVLAVSVFVINHTVLVPLLARDVLGEGVHGFGFLMAALGTGALVGALALAGLGRGQPSLPAVVVPALAVSLATLSLGAVRQFWLAASLLFVTGLAQILFLTGSNTLLQITAPDALRGRVMSLYTLVFAGVTPIGAFFIGSTAETFGVPAAFVAGGGLGLVCVLALTARWTRRRLPAGEPDST
jgi:MFS family permease